MLIFFLLAAIVGYLLGALPFGYWVARARGVDIFAVGSGNPGSTNVRRVLGRGPGNTVLVLDGLKGTLAAGWALLAHTPVSVVATFDGLPAWLQVSVAGSNWLGVGVAGLLGALLGHSFSCFTRFRGGKGVATGAGGFFVLFPLGAAVAAVAWGLTAALTRYVSVASIMAAVALTAVAWLRPTPPLLQGVCTGVMIFVIFRHRTNLARLRAGTENRMGQPPTNPPPP